MKGQRVVFILVLVLFITTGCLKGEQQSIKQVEEGNDLQDDVFQNNNDNGENGNNEADTSDEVNVQLADRTLYLMDSDGLVVPQNIALPEDESKAVAKQVLQYLVQDGPVTELLPNGFQAIIPANTEILGVHITDEGTLIVDVSEEFLQYEAENEQQIVEAITNTVSQFDSVKRMKLRVEGEDITEMPANGTPIAQGYSKQLGMNMQVSSMPVLGQDAPITVYVPKQSQTETYFVPVTTYVQTTEDTLYEDVMEKLLKMDEMNVNGLHVINDGVKLIDTPVFSDGILEITLNDAVLMEKDNPVIGDDVMEMITRTFTAMDPIEAVQVNVDNHAQVKNEQGQVYEHPVTVGYFSEKHKL